MGRAVSEEPCVEYEVIQGERVDKVGFGTWSLTGRACYQAVRSALELGYRHIDTAEMYQNEPQVAQAIADSGVPREQLFITTKVWSSQLRYDQVMRACEDSLQALQLEVIDLYLVHWPGTETPIAETMRAFNDLVQAGKLRRIGVSNFSIAEFIEAQDASAVRLFTNQVPYHVFRRQHELRAYCIEHDILLTAYSPLAKGRLAEHPILAAIGAEYGKTASQVALRWLIQQPKVLVIPKSGDPGRQRQNLELFDFELTPAQMQQIDALSG